MKYNVIPFSRTALEVTGWSIEEVASSGILREGKGMSCSQRIRGTVPSYYGFRNHGKCIIEETVTGKGVVRQVQTEKEKVDKM